MRSSFVRNVCSVLSVLPAELSSFTVMWECCLNKSLTYMHTPLSPALTPVLFAPLQLGRKKKLFLDTKVLEGH